MSDLTSVRIMTRTYFLPLSLMIHILKHPTSCFYNHQWMIESLIESLMIESLVAQDKFLRVHLLYENGMLNFRT